MARLAFALLLVLFLAACCCARDADEYEDAPSKRLWRKIKRFRFRTWFRRRTKPTQAPKPKPNKFDVVFLLDSSHRVDYFSFKSAKGFAIHTLRYFSVFSAKTRVAAVTFNSSATLGFDFKKFVNKECVEKGISNIRNSGGSTDAGKALEYVRTELINNDDAGAREDVAKVIFLFTTGRWSENAMDPKIPAEKLKKAGVKIFVVLLPSRPITYGLHQFYRPSYTGITPYRMRNIASGSMYVFYARSYSAYSRVKELLGLKNPPKCISGKTVLDECGRRCKCVRGKLVDCCRLRKEFLDMSNEERTHYINTVKKASTDPKYKARYEELLTSHKILFRRRIHQAVFFLPWHRWFIQQYENLLREIDCRITVPYWDWSLVGADPLSSDVWNPGSYGLGGDGEGENSCVATGPFRSEVWSLVQSAGGRCLRREFKSRTPDAVAVKELIMTNSDPSDFQDFELALRFEFHDLVHCVIDGTMCTTDSASAPEFFFHHGFVDKIWWDWQKLSRNHTFNEFFVTQTELMTGTPYRSRDYLDLNHQPGCMCAEYVPSRSKIYTALQTASIETLQKIARLPLPEMPEKALKLFGYTKEDLERLHRILKKMEPKEMMKPSSLKGQDRVAGFKTSSIVHV